MKYSIEDLPKLNLHVLRYIGQIVGVKSPCQKRKQELINEILQICKGEKEPTFESRGRPHKNDGFDIELNGYTVSVDKKSVPQERSEVIEGIIEKRVKSATTTQIRRFKAAIIELIKNYDMGK